MKITVSRLPSYHPGLLGHSGIRRFGTVLRGRGSLSSNQDDEGIEGSRRAQQ